MNVGDIITDYNGSKYICVVGGTPPLTPFIPNNIIDDAIVWGDIHLQKIDKEDIGHVIFDYVIHAGYLILDGQTYDRSDYESLVQWVDDNSLWASTSTEYGKFGTGDGSTTFTVPNFIDKFVECGIETDVGEFISAGLPNITGRFTPGMSADTASSPQGAFSWSSTQISANSNISGGNWTLVNFNASNSNPIYGNSITVQPNSVKLIPQIKYI